MSSAATSTTTITHTNLNNSSYRKDRDRAYARLKGPRGVINHSPTYHPFIKFSPDAPLLVVPEEWAEQTALLEKRSQQWGPQPSRHSYGGTVSTVTPAGRPTRVVSAGPRTPEKLRKSRDSSRNGRPASQTFIELGPPPSFPIMVQRAILEKKSSPPRPATSSGAQDGGRILPGATRPKCKFRDAVGTNSQSEKDLAGSLHFAERFVDWDGDVGVLTKVTLVDREGKPY